MANISQIKLPNGDTHHFIDTASGYTKNTGTITGVKTTAGAHTTIDVTSGAVTFNVPTKTSHLTNDSGFKTTDTNTTYSLSNELSSHKFTSTLTAGGSGSGTSTATIQFAAGSNITLTDDTTNKKITIAATDTKYSAGTGLSLSGTTFNISTVPIANGGTGKTTAKDAANTLIDALDTASANWTDNTLILTSDANGDTNLYYRRPATSAWNYIKGKTDAAYLKLTGGSVTGPTTFGDTVSIDDLNAGQLVVSGSASVANNLQANTIHTSSLTIQNQTYATNTYADENPKLIFSNVNASQNISLTFTDYDSVQSPTSLTLNGNQGNEYFMAPNIKATSNLYGGGANITSLNASHISSGTLAKERLATSGATAGSYGPSANASPSHGGTFSVPYVTVDTYGRVTAVSTKTITLPADSNTDTKVTQTNSTSNGDYRVLLSGDANDTTTTTTTLKNTNLRYNPSTGTLKIKGFDSIGSNFKSINCDVSKSEVTAQNSSLTTSSADTDWFQALVKAICVKYPNTTNTVFRGVLAPNSNKYYEIFIYDTSVVNSSTKLPQHSFGRALNYGGGFTKFGTDSYTWRFGNVDTNTNTTYSAGTGLSLSSTTFSVKTGYTTSGNNRAVQADSNGNLYVVQTDTTYSSKAAASGGTDVSLVTTGEKYTWNSKTSNTGTITSVKTTAGAHTAINVTSGAANFNVPTTAAHVGIKFGYTTSGNNRAVAQDSSGNLYVIQKDTTYSSMTAAEITAGNGTTARLITPANLKTAIETWSERDIIQAAGTGSTSLAAGTITQIPLTTTLISRNTYGCFAVASNRVTISKAGIYRITGSVYVSPTANTHIGIYIRMGTGTFANATEIASSLLTGTTGAINVTKIIKVSSTQYVYLGARCYGNAGTVPNNNDATYLEIEYLGN